MTLSSRKALVGILVLLLVGQGQGQGLEVASETGATSTTTDQQYAEPWFYHGLEGPEFTTVSDEGTYEVRQVS